MSMISEKDQQTLQKLFEGLEGDVTITNFIQRESPLIAGLGGECLVAPLFGFTLKGQQKPAA